MELNWILQFEYVLFEKYKIILLFFMFISYINFQICGV
jgi:hypothetical protein